MNFDQCFGCTHWHPFTPLYPRWGWNCAPTTTTSTTLHALKEDVIIHCEDINRIPGFQNVVYPSTTYAAATFGEYNIWAPPTEAELEFWRSVKAMKKKFARGFKLKTSRQCLNEELEQDVEVQELLKKENEQPSITKLGEKRGDKEAKKDKPIIEIREGDSLYGSNGEKREFLCVFCKGNNEPEIVYKSHPIRVHGVVMCPFLRNHTCVICKETGHTIKYCKNNKRGFFAMKSIGKADIFLTAEKSKLAEATATALVEATNSGLIYHAIADEKENKNEIQSQPKKKQSRIPLASISEKVINLGRPKDSIEAEYMPIGRYDVKNVPIIPLQDISNKRQRVKKS